MARNSEKAQSMLFRFRAQQAADLGILDVGRTRRPKVITSIDSIPVAEKWRGQVLKEISRKVSRIQDEALSDYQIRDLNDEINKLFREKWVWERQIRTLGGPNYMRGGAVVDDDGKEVPGGGKGYRYFGRARELPGVKELFEQAKEPPDRAKRATENKTRAELSKNVDAAYYGYMDEDESLLAYEAQREKEAWDKFAAMPDDLDDDAEEVKTGMKRSRKKEEWEPIPDFIIPTVQEVQEHLLERRRKRLMEKLGDE
ncbi:Isy1-like splicing factor [Rhizodiscina lignyota]|uniref:Isy1-like splicing factor n=1 Tax=Rhizodiscina lignyota TaxID=1504668 RepID=A0A9P4M7Z3_9PEZI|nr:Isy1-like splicing factor [Rhizodiscina lignyota]